MNGLGSDDFVVPAGTPGLLDEVLAALEQGELVVLPTETVYGLALREDSEQAQATLYRMKKRRRSKKLARLAAGPEDIEKTVPDAPRRALMLARKFWPGRLTIVVKKGDRTWGFRCPAHPFTLAVARHAPFPVSLTSANVSGRSEPISVEDVLDEGLDPFPALVVDGGVCRYARPSTVVMVEGDRVSLLRAGALPARVIPFLEEE